MVRIPALDTMADLLERLIIVDNRMAWLEQQKRDLVEADAVTIAKLDRASRDCCEARSAIKNRINEAFEGIVQGDEYRSLRESRSFRPPDERFAETLDRHSREIAHLFTGSAFGARLRAELLGEDHSHTSPRVEDTASEVTD